MKGNITTTTKVKMTSMIDIFTTSNNIMADCPPHIQNILKYIFSLYDLDDIWKKSFRYDSFYTPNEITYNNICLDINSPTFDCPSFETFTTFIKKMVEKYPGCKYLVQNTTQRWIKKCIIVKYNNFYIEYNHDINDNIIDIKYKNTHSNINIDISIPIQVLKENDINVDEFYKVIFQFNEEKPVEDP